MTLFTLGPEGTFSHEVAARLDPDVRLCPTIASRVDANRRANGSLQSRMMRCAAYTA